MTTPLNKRLGLASAALLAVMFLSLSHFKTEEPPVSNPVPLPARLPEAAPPAPVETNETLHARQEEEKLRMGIKAILPLGSAQEEEATPKKFLKQTSKRRKERQEYAELYMRELAAMRRAMGNAEKGPVPISGRTSVLLASEAPSGQPTETPKYWSGPKSGRPQGNQVISDLKSWRELWGNISSGPVPEIDFAQNEAVAVFLGPRPSAGYRVDIKEVFASESERLVRYFETPPPPQKTSAPGATSPYALLLLPRSSLPVRFEEVKE